MTAGKPSSLPGQSGVMLDGLVSDSVELANPVRAIRVGSGGNLVLVTFNDQEIILEGLSAGEKIDLWIVKQIRRNSQSSPSVETTASNLVGTYD